MRGALTDGLRRRVASASAGRGIPIAVLLLARQCSTLTTPQAPLGGGYGGSYGGYGGLGGQAPVLATTTPWGFTSTFPA